MTPLTDEQIREGLELAAKATPGPWELWQDNPTVFAGPAKENTPAVLRGYRGLICDLDSGHIDTDELEDVGESEWTPEERIVMNRDNDAAFIAAARTLLPAALEEPMHPVWNPLESISDAFMLVEKMREDRWWVRITGPCGEGTEGWRGWHVAFYKIYESVPRHRLQNTLSCRAIVLACKAAKESS